MVAVYDHLLCSHYQKHILCGYCKESLHTDKVAGAEGSNCCQLLQEVMDNCGYTCIVKPGCS